MNQKELSMNAKIVPAALIKGNVQKETNGRDP